jgi:hypothetical protein
VICIQTDPVTARWLGEQTLRMPVHIAGRYFAQLAGIDFRHRITNVDLPVLAMWGRTTSSSTRSGLAGSKSEPFLAGGSSGSSTAGTVRWSTSRRGWPTCSEASLDEPVSIHESVP